MDDRTLDRFMSKVQVQPNGCWWRESHVRKDGYCNFSVGGKTRLAHVVSFEHFSGPIPEGFDVDHICHNEDKGCEEGRSCKHRRCCNPEHLNAVDHRTNCLNGRNGYRDFCVNGHEMTEDNSYYPPSGGRECRTCRDLRSKEWMRIHNPGVQHGTETHCPQGHPYSGDNLYVHPTSGGRICRTCKRDNAREWARRKALRKKSI